MFSGEALDKAKSLCDSLMQVYVAGITTITECLSAQYYVSKLPEEYKDKINSEYKSHICWDANDIISEIKEISDPLLASEKKYGVQEYVDDNGKTYPADSLVTMNTVPGVSCGGFINTITVMYINDVPVYKRCGYVLVAKEGTLKAMYTNVFNKSRRILVNKNSTGNGYQVNDKLNFLNHSDNPYNTGKYSCNKATVSAEWLNQRAADNQISFDDIKAMASYCANKGITIRSLLNSVGIDTSAVPQNANIITSKGIDDTDNDAKVFFTAVLYSNGYYMGINIDQAGATEQKIKFIDDGTNFWKQEEWAWAPAGAFCWLTK